MKKFHLFPSLLLLIFWAFFIFSHSLKPAPISSSESQWLMTQLQNILLFDLNMHALRKAAHFIEFAILGSLLQTLFTHQRCSWRACLICSVSAALLIALCDEAIQLFVPGRSGNAIDVFLDSTGAVFGAVLRVMFHRRSVKRNFPICTPPKAPFPRNSA